MTEDELDRIYCWHDSDAQKHDYPYIKDDTDIAAFNAYAKKRRMFPPMRPSGFIDEHEEAVWGRWRAWVESHEQT